MVETVQTLIVVIEVVAVEVEPEEPVEVVAQELVLLQQEVVEMV